MKNLIPLIIILSFFSCRGPKTISQTSDTTTEIKTIPKEVFIEILPIAIVDTTDLSRLNRGETINKTDTKTGIKTSYQIKNNRLITSIDVPKRTQKVIVNDTKTTITIKEKVIQEQKRNFWERLKEHVNTLMLLAIILLALVFLFNVVFKRF